MVTDKEIKKAREKLKKKHKKYLLMNQEKKEERAYYKKHGYPKKKVKEILKVQKIIKEVKIHAVCRTNKVKAIKN